MPAPCEKSKFSDILSRWVSNTATAVTMLPILAVVFGSGRITVQQMRSAGIWLNVIGVVLISACAFALVQTVLIS